MEIVADLHIHSYLSRACSPQLKPEILYQWCQRKGITVLATGDFTHPKWFAELQQKLVPAEPGLFQLKPSLARAMDQEVAPTCRAPVRFLLGVEISCIYKKNGRVRKNHHLVFVPSFEAATKFNAALEKIGNIRSDGRPILGLDSKNLLSLVLESSDQSYLVPAHAWTPHFGVLGSQTGFDTLDECFEDLTPHIFAIETGLSSDPPMNWRLSQLDRITLISNSDAHSPEKLGREANVFHTELSYQGIFDPLRTHDASRLISTLEFFPEEGKYHIDGHRNCEVRMTPQETIARNSLCRVCEKPVTVGVLYRVEKLADRPLGYRPKKVPGYENLVPLKEILSEVLDVGPASGKVDKFYHRLLSTYGSELFILRKMPLERLEQDHLSVLALALGRMRQGKATVSPGYDGEYGKVSLLNAKELQDKSQLALWS